MKKQKYFPFSPSFLLVRVFFAGFAFFCLPPEAKAENNDRLETLRALYQGPEVKNRDQLQEYTGAGAADRIVNPWQKKGFVLNYEQLAANYAEGVDFQLRREQVLLCPQTADYLYGEFTPTKVSYRRGSRPQLEKLVENITGTLSSDQDKALALMRFCRDLKKKEAIPVGPGYIYGGTEEYLIEHGTDLCEVLGRLFVGLCEIAGIPARIVMHDIGGHITAEAYLDGHWGYIDPKLGLYFCKPDGTLASVWELWLNPALLRDQTDAVKADIGGSLSWDQRIENCEKKYFHLFEINGVENYSLNDSARYSYGTLSWEEAVASGLYRINEVYNAVADHVLGLAPENRIERYFWTERPLPKKTMAYRHDGFSPWAMKPPVTPDMVNRRLVDCFAGTNVDTLVWGLGPGSVFCFETKIGEIFGTTITDVQWKDLMRDVDRNIYENIQSLLQSGHPPLRLVTDRSHEKGLKIYARLEMNHEFGPVSPDNFSWVGMVGSFNKKHPEFRIPGTKPLLDFKYPEVRDFKQSILREAAEIGVDGIEMDFAVYPPYFADPRKDYGIMTQFVRDIRTMLDEVGQNQKRRLHLMVRLPYRGTEEFGLDWRTWMHEKLIDEIVPTHKTSGKDKIHFDIRIDDFVELGKQTGVKAYGCLFHSLGTAYTDPQKDGKPRYGKPKTPGMFKAQALLLHRAGVDATKLSMPADEWNLPENAYFNDLADPDLLEFADKHYMVNPFPQPEGIHPVANSGGPFSSIRSFRLRIADHLEKARSLGLKPEAELQFYVRPLQPEETIEVYINSQGPLIISGDSPEEHQRTDTRLIAKPVDEHAEEIHNPDWWRRGEHIVSINPNWLWFGENIIRFVFSAKKPDCSSDVQFQWTDLLIRYKKL